MGIRVPNRYRLRTGKFASDDSAGNNGAFKIPTMDGKRKLFVLASDGGGWEHVSVSTNLRTPTWNEMCHIKNMFWDKEDLVLQFHPPQSKYVDCCEFCLHLWRPLGRKIELPPRWMLAP